MYYNYSYNDNCEVIILSAIGENISRKLKEQGLSQNRLAKLSGVSQSNISSILSNTKSPSVDTIRLLADALGCTVAELLGEAPVDQGMALSGDARRLLADYKALSPQGREYIRQQMAMALKVYPGESVSLPNVEAE